MAKKFLVNIDLGGNQLLSARVQNGTASPTSYGKGQLWFDSTNNIFNVYNGTLFQPLATQSYVTGLGYLTSSGSIAYATNAGSSTYATNAGNSTTTSQTTFTNLSTGSIAVTSSTDSNSTSTGVLTVSGGVGIAKNVYIGGNLDVSGSVYVSGSAFTVSASNITLSDPMIYLADLNPSNLVDIGIVGNFNNGTYQHTGLVRDASDSIWKLFSRVIPEPTTTINFASATYDTLLTGGLLINSSSTTQTASISGAGALYAQSGTFVSSVNLGSSIATGSVQFATTASNTSQTNFTALTISGSNVATQAYVLANVGGAGTASKQTSTIVGDNTTTNFSVGHTLNTRDIMVRVYQTSTVPDTQYADVEVDITRTTASAVTIGFATAPAATASYNVVIVG